MNKNILQLNKIIQLGIGVLILGVFLIPYTSKAVSVSSNYTDNWIFYQYINRGGCRGGDFRAYTQFYMSLYKSFDLNSSSLGNLNQNESRSIIPEETITGINYPITGSYNYYSSDTGTPPMDNQVYDWEYWSGRGACGAQFYVKNQMRAGIYDQLGYQLSSSNNNIIDCSNGQSCVAKSQNGTATITVSFPGTGYYYVQRAYQFGGFATDYLNATCDTEVISEGSYSGGDNPGIYTPPGTREVNCTCPSGTNLETQSYVNADVTQYYNVCSYSYFAVDGGNIVAQSFSYTLNPISYNITVNVPDNPPTISNIQAQEVGYNDGMVSWNYSDADADAQEWWNVQISTTPDFNPDDIVIWSGEPQIGSGSGAGTKNSNDTSTDFFPQNRGKLIPGTTYYTRVQVGNAKASSGWVDGPEFITQSYPQANINFNVIDSDGGATIAGDGIQFTWSITNPIGVQSCNASTTGGTDAGNGIWTGNKAVSESPNTENAILALSQLNRPYNFTINCIPKTGANAIQPVTVSLNTIGREALVTLSSNISTDLKQGDFVNISRTIVNREVLTGCSNTVTGGPVAAGGNFISDSTTNDLISPPSREQIDPNIRSNATYIFTSTCSPIDGPSRSSSITVTVRPRPSISCNLQNKVVAENNNIIKLNLIGDSTWSGPYEWRVKRGIGTDLIYSNSALNNTVDLNYSDAINLGLGKYDIKAQLNAGGINSDEATCGSINSLGNRTIREVAK